MDGTLTLIREGDKLLVQREGKILFDDDFTLMTTDRLYEWMETEAGLLVPTLGSPLMMGSKPRSGKWPHARAEHLVLFPTCAACGGVKLLEVHHKKPYHEHPDLELDPKNFITLCNYHGCHLIIGHLCSWYSYNPHVEEDAAAYLKKVQSRP